MVHGWICEMFFNMFFQSSVFDCHQILYFNLFIGNYKCFYYFTFLNVTVEIHRRISLISLQSPGSVVPFGLPREDRRLRPAKLIRRLVAVA